MKRISNIFIFFLILFLSACSVPKDITYMQGLKEGDLQNVSSPSRMLVQPDDNLSILVTSKDTKTADIFNKAISNYIVGTGTPGEGINMSKVATFNVSSNGDIDYPLIGKIHIAGMTRREVAEKIKSLIISEGLLKDPVVSVDFLKANISVLGDVAKPGEYPIDNDNLTILQALAKAGDLNITGDRTNVLVMREENGQSKAFRLDLTDANSMLASPAYYLRQNDVVYVEPNNTKKRQSTEMGNVFYNPTIWISVVSVLTSIAVIIFR